MSPGIDSSTPTQSDISFTHRKLEDFIAKLEKNVDKRTSKNAIKKRFGIFEHTDEDANIDKDEDF